MPDYLSIFLIGLMSGFSHCYGMCGGFVMAYTLAIPDTSAGYRSAVWLHRVRPHLLYNGGRILTYTLLGALFGLASGTLRHLVDDFQNILLIAAGLFMIVIGLDLAGLVSFGFPRQLPGTRFIMQKLGNLNRSLKGFKVLYYGILLGFLPCGLVYVAGARAVATGSLTGGMLTMLFFGLGTLPALWILGFGTGFITTRFRRRLFPAAALMVILYGLLTLWQGGSNLLGGPSFSRFGQHEHQQH